MPDTDRMGGGVMEFQFVPVSDLRFDLKGVTVGLRKVMEEEAKVHRDLLRKTTAKWTGTKPQFRSSIIAGPTQLSIESGPYGKNGEGYKKWWWLEAGTKIRWAVMSSKWRSKTRGAWLGSRKGRGRVVIFGKRAMMRRNIAARPGIEPRNWLAEVNKERSRKFKGRLQREFELIARNTITPKSLRR